MDIILKYFPDLSAQQIDKFKMLLPLYREWNSRINVISRKDIDHLYERHILYSLSIAKIIQFKPGTKILDAGTGGGFPGIPLAILFPDVQFDLVDSIGKKIRVVEAIANTAKLNNVTSTQCRVEDIDQKFDFIISRAVAGLPRFYAWVKDKVKRSGFNELSNGIIYLKGGEVSGEMAGLNAAYAVYPIKDFFEEPYFETKLILHVW